ncbi:MAG: PAS domain S-box protein, partial [Gallionellaceae bacterium]|nr:PAS domain S-box protein [Gallionellaceae bacterium]
MTKNRDSEVRILIVEDSPTQAEQLAHLLEQRGYAVTTASNGREALAALEHAMPTLVISDVLMPQLDGYGLCKALKSDVRFKHLPVVLLTVLSDTQEIIRGLECGADNFIRKPYDENYLLSRIEYILMNSELHKGQKIQVGMEINLGGQKHFITAERQQMLDLLISTYEQSVYINHELKLRDKELEHSNEVLNGLYRIADGLNHANGEREVAEITLERALELPGIQAGWISLRTGETGFRLAASRNLPPALAAPGAMEGDCLCRRRLAAAGELDHSTNIIKCERLEKARGDTQGLRYHASVPLWVGDRTLGVMNLVGPEEGLFNDAELKILYGVGHQVAVALERARLQENLEQLVKERTAALRQSESWFRAVFNSQQDAVFVTTPEGKIINANSAVEKIFGYTVAELKGRSMALLQVDEQHYVNVTQYVQQALVHDSAIHFEHQLKRKNGEIFPTEHTFSPLLSETGKLEGLVRVIRDITERREHEGTLRLSATVFNTMDEAVMVTDSDNRIIAVNPAFTAITGYSADEVIGKNPHILSSCLHPPEFYQELRETLTATGSWSGEIRNRRKNGEIYVEWLSIKQVRDENANLTHHVAVFSDISERKAIQERIQYMAHHDALTDLPNRILLSDRLQQAIAQARRDKTHPALMLLDLDRFKPVNDELGHDVGDLLLKEVAQRLQNCMRESDTAARIGGDEFIVLLPTITEEQDAILVAEKILYALGQPFELAGHCLHISVSIGVVIYP